MTSLLDAPAASSAREPGAMDAAPRRRASAWARWRVALRLARRQAWHARGSSTLVMLLIALPVLGMTGGAVFWQSHVPSPQQSATLELGRNETWLTVVGGPDPSRTQSVDQPWDNSVSTDGAGQPINPQLPAPDDAGAVLPAGASTIEVREQGSLFVDTAGGTGRVPVTVGSVWDPVFAGRYAVIDGAAPAADDEAMVSPGLLDRLGARIGQRLTLSDSGRSFTIAGTMRQLDQRPQDDMLFLPAGAAALAPEGFTRWFVADWQPDLDELTELNHAGFIAYARDLVIEPPGGAATYVPSSSALWWQMLAVGSIVAVFCGYLVVLLAGAAFAVATRRQQRALAVAASVGAARGDVFRIVVLQGTVLGTVGGVLGVALGIGAAGLTLWLTDDGVKGSFWGNWGLQIPWPIVCGILLFAVVIGTLSALAPARGATRGDVLAALRGSRRPSRLNAKRPLWGLGLMILGVVATVAGALTIAALNLAESIDYSSPLRVIALYGIVFGPVAFQIGILLAGHWTLTMISRALSHLGIAPRLAGRDAAANPSRVVPAFAAIAACVFLASFTLSATALTASASSRHYAWNGPKDAVSVTIWSPDGGDDLRAGEQAARGLIDPTHPLQTALVSMPPDAPYDPETGANADPDAVVWRVASTPGTCGTDCPAQTLLASATLSVIAADEVETVLGEKLPADALTLLRDGGLLSVAGWASHEEDGTARITRWTGKSLDAYNAALNGYWSAADDPEARSDPAELPGPDAVRTLAASTVELQHAPGGMIGAIITPETATALGIGVAPWALFAVYAQPPSDEDVDAITLAAQNVRLGDSGALSVMIERGPEPVYPWLWLICGVAIVLVIAAGAICLGLARFERRPDDATLTAVGAGRGIRRRVNAWQAAILVGIGTVVGTVAGLIPTWGISLSSQDYLRISDAPWLWLAILAVGLPLIMTVAAWLVPPRRPDLTRRTAIT
ncbi:FtsX-like permease family protein [Microbacterium sp. NEAU-LLC]|uniref:FtsX-like permease family protein n=1 Tax=Microbacterium helvum TaxID=2773713 RepID=A0ABR8NRK5_9MICO|nr:FtsX-like permease family protein [Microbacterium helvum]MBD3943272.1 FtsX-like permease family protein [Microbacterium helvum]